MARPKSEAPALIDAEAAPETSDNVAVVAVRVKAFKLNTSRCMALEGQEIDLPEAEAAKFIASGDAEAI